MLQKAEAHDAHEQISLKEIPLFSRLSYTQIETLWEMLHFTTFREGDVILAEGSRTRNQIFIIVNGSVSLCKTGHSPLTHETLEYEVELRGEGDVFGAMSIFDGKPTSMGVKARTPVTIAILDMKPYRWNRQCRALRNIITTELRRTLSNYVRNAIDHKVDSLRQEAEFTHYRNAVGGIVIAALSLLSVYTLALGAMPGFESYLNVNFALSPFIIFVFAAIFLPVILLSGFPIAFFGLCLHNCRHALIFSCAMSLLFIGVAALVKWSIILGSPSVSHLSVISISEVRIGDEAQVALAPHGFGLRSYSI